MDEVDDGIGSELNTPRDGIHPQVNDSLNTSLDAATSVLPQTSTPICRQLRGIVPMGCDLSQINEVSTENTHTALHCGDLSQFDSELASALVTKQQEVLEFSESHDKTLQKVASMQEIISQLQSRIGSAESTIADLNAERNDHLTQLEHYKNYSEEKEVELDRCKEELLMAQRKIEELQCISVEVETYKETDRHLVSKLTKESERYKALVEELERSSERREKDWKGEKEALIVSANKERCELAEWRDRATRLDQLAISQDSRLKHFEDLEHKLSDSVKKLAQQRSKTSELSRELQVQSDNAKKHHDEVLHLRVKLDDMREVASCKKVDSKSSEELSRLRAQCESLHRQADADREFKTEWSGLKRSNEEMVCKLETQDTELVQLRDALGEKRKQLDSVEDERSELKKRCAQFEIDLSAMHTDFVAFQEGAEMQYQTEMARLHAEVQDRDERLERLHTRIAEYELYPGMGTSMYDESFGVANRSVWEMMPQEVRDQLDALKQQYKELDGVVQHLMHSHVAANEYSTECERSKIMEDKMTDCEGLVQQLSEGRISEGTQSGHELPQLESVGSADAFSERTFTETPTPSCDPPSEGIQITLSHLLRSIRMAEVNGKLTPNIRQLLERLLVEVSQSSQSDRVEDSVNRFFGNLDQALRRTLNASEDNRRKCEELGKNRIQETEERRVLAEELRAAQDRYAVFESKTEALRLQLKEESRTVIVLRNDVEQLNEQLRRLDASNTSLKGIISQQQSTIDDKESSCRKYTEYLEDFRVELEKLGAYSDHLNERLRQVNHDKEDLRRSLVERDSEMERLQERLVDSIKKCTTQANETSNVEKRLTAAQLQNDMLKRKYEKRESFLEQMEALLRAMKLRNDALREANRLRQTKLDIVLKFLLKHGVDVGERFDSQRPQSALEEGAEDGYAQNGDNQQHNANGTALRCSAITDADVTRLMRRLDRYPSQRIEMQEREGDMDDVRIPSWRNESGSNAGSKRVSESADQHTISPLPIPSDPLGVPVPSES